MAAIEQDRRSRLRADRGWRAGFDLVEMEIFLPNPQSISRHGSASTRPVGDHRLAATLVGVSGLALPHQLIEIRAIAYTG
nr:hypothetical protein [Rhizobium leguminosarum]